MTAHRFSEDQLVEQPAPEVQQMGELFEHVYQSYQGEGRSIYNRVT